MLGGARTVILEKKALSKEYEHCELTLIKKHKFLCTVIIIVSEASFLVSSMARIFSLSIYIWYFRPYVVP